MSHDSDPQDYDALEDYGPQHYDALEQIQSLFLRAIKGDADADDALPPHQLACRILHLIQQRLDSTDDDGSSCAESERRASNDDTPHLEGMGWGLWGIVDDLARENRRNHHILVAFINQFIPLLQTKPWNLWGNSVKQSCLLLGATFRESLQGAGPHSQDPPATLNSTSIHLHYPAADDHDSPPPTLSEKLEISDTTSDSVLLPDSERRIRRWCNFCRFVARMTRDTEQSFFSLYLLWFAREALEEQSDCPEAAILAFEEVIDVCGVSMFHSNEEFGRSGSSDSGPWKGFCKERWIFWEDGLRSVACDEAQSSRARASALRTLARMDTVPSRRSFSGASTSSQGSQGQQSTDSVLRRSKTTHR